MQTNKVKLEICGANYVINTTDSEEYVKGLAARLETDMNEMMALSPSISTLSSAVITALGYLDEGEKNAAGADNMRAQIRNYLEDASKAKLAAEEASREVEHLRREVQRLREQHR